nr:ORF [Hepatitis E virus]
AQRLSLTGNFWFHPEGLLGPFAPFSPGHVWESANPFCGESTLYTRTWSEVDAVPSPAQPDLGFTSEPSIPSRAATPTPAAPLPPPAPDPSPTLSAPARGEPAPGATARAPAITHQTARHRRLLFTYPDGSKVFAGSLFE